LFAAIQLPNFLAPVARKMHGVFSVTDYNLGGLTVEGYAMVRNSFPAIHLVAGDSIQLTWKFNGYEMTPGPVKKIRKE
jgi:hypothetical protein